MMKYLIPISMVFVLTVSCNQGERQDSIRIPSVPDNACVPVDEGRNGIREILSDGFSLRNENSKGAFKSTLRGLELAVEGRNAIYGVPAGAIMSHQFETEVEAHSVSGYGLALIKMEDGRPDTRNYVLVSVKTVGGYRFVEVLDCQNGKNDVLDNTGAIPPGDRVFRYTQLLNGEEFSVPFIETNGKLKILRNDISGFFHIYYGVKKRIRGRKYETWMELASVKDWNISGTEFAAVPLVRSSDEKKADVLFTKLITREFSSEDREISEFSIKEREYVWSGFKGNGIVIGFNPMFCRAATPETKFIFWSEMNYVPGWSINNDMIYSYEFCETWRATMEHSGCYEPMSDRLLAFNRIKNIEDKEVRKTVQFHYALINPDYIGPYTDGTYPEVDEYYTIYPDGVGIREINYYQSMGGQGEYRYHELAEPMVMAGSEPSLPADYCKKPSFIVSNRGGDKFEFYPDRSGFAEARETVKTWPEQIYRSRLVNSPDIFCVFTYSPNRLQTAPLPIENDLNWHNTTYQFSHWPVDKQKYLGVRSNNFASSRATWPSQVSHTSFIGVEAKGDTDWNGNYKLGKGGRKYRTYLMMFGLLVPDDERSIDGYISSWLFDGELIAMKGAIYNKNDNDYSKREIVLQMEADECSFDLAPARTLKNPVFRLNDWGKDDMIEILLNNRKQVEGVDFLASPDGDDLIVWLSVDIKEDTNFIFRACQQKPNSPNRRISFRNWENCIELSNKNAVVIINPAYGGNVLSFRLSGGQNMMWADTVVNGWHLEDYITTGRSPDAGRFDIGNERKTENIHDELWAGRYDIVSESKNYLVMRSPVSDKLGIYLERTFTLNGTDAELIIEQKIINVTDHPVTYCFWTRTLLPSGGRYYCTVDADADLKYSKISLKTDLLEDDLSERILCDGEIFTAFPGGEGESKWGIRNTDGRLSYELNGTRYTKTVDIFPDGRYENNAGNIFENMIYFNSKFIEMEPNSPMFEIPPGESVSVTEVWNLSKIK